MFWNGSVIDSKDKINPREKFLAVASIYQNWLCNWCNWNEFYTFSNLRWLLAPWTKIVSHVLWWIRRMISFQRMGFQKIHSQMDGKEKLVFMLLVSQGEAFLVHLWMQWVCLMTLPRAGKRKLNRKRKQWQHATGDAYHTSN